LFPTYFEKSTISGKLNITLSPPKYPFQ
jgi:hypothetical protein